MKRFFTILAMTAALVGCSKSSIYGPTPVPEPEVKSAGIDITIADVKDNSFSLTLAPKGEATYYSYVVVKADNPSKLDSASVYAGKVKGVASDIIKYTDEKKSTTVTIDGLAAFATYQVYAVAGSKTGIPSAVEVKSVKTSNTTIPGPKSASFDKASDTFAVTFTESVEYVEGKKVTVNIYAINSAEIKTNAPYKTGEAEVSTSGAVASFKIKDLPAGAYVTVSYEAGAFVDVAGNSCNAFNSVLTYDAAKKAVSVKGIGAQKATAKFPLSFEDDAAPEVITKLSSPIALYAPEGTVIVGEDATVNGKVVYLTDAEKREFKAAAGVKGYTFVAVNATTAAVIPNYNPTATGRPNAAPGTMIGFSIPSFLIDVYGNKNEELEVEPILFSYGFTTADVIGTYVLSGKTVFSSKKDESPWGMTIEASDNASKGNVMITSWYNFDCKIYAKFDGDLGTLTMPIDEEPLGGFADNGVYYDFYTQAYYSTLQEEATGYTLYMTESGVFTDSNDYPGYLFYAFQIPDGVTDPEKICTDDNYLGLGYNNFVDDWEKQTGSTTAVSSLPIGNFQYTPGKINRKAISATIVRKK